MSIKRIEPMRPLLPTAEELTPYLRQIDANRTYSNFGPLYNQFVSRIADYLSVKSDNIALFGNGTLALQAAIETVGKENNTWIMPSWTFIATAQATHSARRNIHFVDIHLDTWAINPTEHPDATGHIIVAPFGSKPAINQWASIPGWKLFDAASCFDACRNIGTELDDQTAIMISLHATKPLPAGEGAILIGPQEWIHRARCWGNFGFDGTRIATRPGLNAKISEYHCAIGLASLDKWDNIRTALQRRTIKARTISHHKNVQIQPSFTDGYLTTTWNIRLSERNLDSLEAKLNDAGIGTRRWWPTGIHQMPQFTHCSRDPLPNTIELSNSVLGLPLSIDLTDEEFDRIASNL